MLDQRTQEFFRGKKVLVTGAASGIGQAVSKLLDKCELVDIQPISAMPHAHVYDVGELEAVRELFGKLAAEARTPDIVIHCAGTNAALDAENFSAEECFRVMQTNFIGTVNIVENALKHMTQGHITIVASIAGMRGLPHGIAYGPSKAAQINFAETLRWQLKPRGIHICCVAPGFVDTPMNKHLKTMKRMPFMLTPEQAASKILWATARQKRFYVFPRRARLVISVAKLFPAWLFDKMIASLFKKFHA